MSVNFILCHIYAGTIEIRYVKIFTGNTERKGKRLKIFKQIKLHTKKYIVIILSFFRWCY